MRIVENAPIKSRRRCAGLYYVSNGVYEDRLDHSRTITPDQKDKRFPSKVVEVLSEVEVISYSKDEGAPYPYWMARALWVGNLYTDPLPTKADAMRQAAFMLEDRKKEIAEWISAVEAKKKEQEKRA